MRNTKAFDINSLFHGSLVTLRTEAAYFSRLTDHNPELGRLNESHLVKLLRAYLPPKIGIGTGFIVCGGEHPAQSPQCDIVLYDSLNNAPFYNSVAWSIYPIEMVYGVIEVKTTLNKKELEDAFDKCAKIRAMAKTTEGNGNKSYICHVSSGPEPAPTATYVEYKCDLPPRFFVFAYDGWKTSKVLKGHFKDMSINNQAAHIHGVCSLYDHGSYYIQHMPYKKGDERFSQVFENGFRYLLMNISNMVDSMLPAHRLGMGFDLVNLTRYDLNVGSSNNNLTDKLAAPLKTTP